MFALGLLVTFHEFGHYLVARLCNVKVLRFSLGLGKPIYSRRMGKDQTEWAVAAFPVGGYVKMLDEREGDVDASEVHRAFNRQSVGKRFAIVVAGPLANFLLAICLYWALFVAGVPGVKPYIASPPVGSPAASAGLQKGDLVRRLNNKEVASWQDLRWMLLHQGMKDQQVTLEVETPTGAIALRSLNLSTPDGAEIESNFIDGVGLSPYRVSLKPQVGRILEGSVAEAAGLKSRDLIISVDDKPVATWEAFVDIVRASPEKRLSLLVKRGEEIKEVTLRPAAATENQRSVGRIGTYPFIDETQYEYLKTTVKYPLHEALLKAVDKVWETSMLSLKMLGKMIAGGVSWKNLSGPITMADYAGQSAQLGWQSYLTYLALISLSIGVLNLLPIPLLDGGHLMYYMAEIIKGSPVSQHAMEIGSSIGFVLLFGLMAFAFYNDINRLLTG